MFPNANKAAICMEVLHSMVVGDSNYKVCTIIADPSGTANPVDLQLISHTETSFPEAMLNRLRDRLGRFFQEELGLQVSDPSVPSQEKGSTLEDSELGLPSDGQIEDEIEDEFNKEVESLEEEIDRTAEDEDEQRLQRDNDDTDFAMTEAKGRNITTQDNMDMNIDSDLRVDLNVVDTDCHMGLVHSDSNTDSDAGSTVSAAPHRPKKQRMAYVLVPSVKRQSTPRSLPHFTISTPPSVRSAAVPGQLSAQEEDILSSFMLTDDELKEVSYTGSAYRDAEETFKYTYGIDLAKVPGRTREWSNFLGVKSWNATRHLQDSQDETAIPASNTLFNDPDLSTIGCAYLNDYDLIVCQNTHEGRICGQAIPLSGLMSHCYKIEGGSSLSHKIPFCKRSDKKVTYKQKLFVGRLLLRYPNIVVTQGELKDIRMRSDQFGPVLHVPCPTEGYGCSHCDFATPSRARTLRDLKAHWEAHVKQGEAPLPRFKRGSQRVLDCDNFISCQVQTLSTLHTSVMYLKVPPPHPTTNHPSRPSRPPTLTNQSAGALLATFVALNESNHPSVNPTLLLPFFRDIRAGDFIQRIDATTANQLVSIPSRQESALFRLKIFCTREFEATCNLIQDSPIIVQEALVKPKVGQRRMTERFRCPTRRSTITMYGLQEAVLLCFVLRCIQQNLMREDMKTPWDGESFYLALTPDQVNSFRRLLTLLQQVDSSDEDLSRAIKAARKSLYMPEDTFHLLMHPFLSAIIVFICLRSVHPEGGFWSPKRLTTIYAKTQFSIRLFLLQEAQEMYAIYDGQDGDTDGKYWGFMNWLEDFIARWATEDHVSPLSILRRWIRALSRIAMITPTATCILWDASHSSLSVKGHVVSIAAYKSHVRKTLEELIDFVNHEVLFDVDLPQDAYSLPDSDNDDIESRGHGLFPLSKQDLNSGNHPSSLFLAELQRFGMVYQVHQNRLQWDSQKLTTWLSNITAAWSSVLVLLHLLSLPARGTEEVVWQHSNSVSRPRNLFLSPHLKTLVTQSNYSKTTAITGVFKYIIRPIPFKLARIIGILLRIIRPIEMMAVMSEFASDSAETIYNNYSTYMFVSFGKVWDSNRLSAAIKEWFTTNLDVPFGLNLHRHFAQALQRKFHSHQTTDAHGDASNRGFGHSAEVADLNYARQPGDLTIGISERQKYEVVGMSWLNWHEIDISPSS
ncbi:hypothetical protein L210DRAFT_3650015 [Boletus edulis BED1]|uniref:Uncharacterized protein n=1 Tax=Boletus edulis BED1 TaxID=1328754 RepID=A0AAD4G9Z0_BOLED|nr:hypothetical protein L210DRAFT_3650015 [Boletus edulis BED1]